MGDTKLPTNETDLAMDAPLGSEQAFSLGGPDPLRSY